MAKKTDFDAAFDKNERDYIKTVGASIHAAKGAAKAAFPKLSLAAKAVGATGSLKNRKK